MWGGKRMLSRMLFILIVIAGHSTMGASKRGDNWLMGFGSQVESAIELTHRGVQDPGSVSNSQLEETINNLGSVSSDLESQIDDCKSCSKSSYTLNRRKALNQKAMITFFRNLLIVEFNKPASRRNFSSALKLALRIRSFS